MKKQEFNCMDMALKMAENGRKVYPTVAGRKMPFKGSHGYKDATSDPEQVFEMFQAHPGADVEVLLENLIVLDVDRHETEHDGFTSLAQANIDLPKTRTEATPNNGMHLFFSYKGVPFNHLDLLPGVEVRGDHIKIAPSQGYTLAINAPIEPAPDWLLSLITKQQKPKYQPKGGYVPGRVTFLAKKINELFDGAPEGTRNDWLTKQVGFLLGQGCTVSATDKLMWYITQTELIGSKPITRNEFEATLKGLVRREVAKMGGDND